MPSRQIPPPPPLPPSQSPSQPIPSATQSLIAAFSILSILVFLFRKIISRKRTTATAPSDSRPLPHRFSYSVLRRATNSFSHRLGQGGFGPVFSGSLNGSPPVPIAVKVMDSGSLQGEREFHNELFFASKLHSPHLVPVLGFSSDRKRRRMLLVYELMQNGNLQDALLRAKRPPELMDWKRRLSVALDIARGLEYLHGLDPPVIHGDIKPSNILLDQHFSAKIGDFGLTRLKSENQIAMDVDDGRGLEGKKGHGGGGVEDCGSVIEETESVITNFEDFNGGLVQSPSPSPETLLPETVVAPVSPSVSEGNFDKRSVESGKELVDIGRKRSGKGIKSVSGRDWWPWKQENGEVEIKNDYVMEWIGTEINNERPTSDWIGASSGSGAIAKSEKKKKNRRRLEWWVSMDEENNEKNSKRRPAREWWKEEYCEDLARKKKKKNISSSSKKKKKQMGVSSDDNGDDWWPRDESLHAERKKRWRSRSQSSRGSIDRWLDGLSGELRRARRNSHDYSFSGEIAKSGDISSTPSMRGTVCYVAPEYGVGEDISEKCDVYSYGVVLLVLISGRRPLQLMNTPISEFQRANLLSWARQLARAGKLLDLVDKSVQFLDREEALLCITVALLCLQKSPARRPSMKEVVGMLTGQSERPQLPVELSPSTPSRFPYKSHKTIR
ncbi:hypothetical protein I3843_03G093700 [Carya illinoinensis]|uniref:Protein kinase domain-containing protein n=1 Tax=Carya illinoinensis TaxID=32201 RepID=A0A922FI88_CARIL|nr:hypothetical protein I3842_03G094100 [Carya illinoinensis]KAG7986684.1 hypothetical protein I3843_03G093700 [Carya illinoinensis]